MPLYTEANASIFAGLIGEAMMEVPLTTPLPVVAGQTYSFVFEQAVRLAFDADRYADGNFIGNFSNVDGTLDLQFEVDFIGPTTQSFTEPGEYPVTVYAVDNRGDVSDACQTTFTLIGEAVYNVSTGVYYVTIAEAIEDLPLASGSEPAETIIIAPGSYDEAPDFRGRKVSLRFGALPARVP